MKNNSSRFTRILLLLFVVLLTAFAGQKYYVFKMTEEQAQYHWQNLETIKAFMDQSNLPHNQVKQVIGAIDSLQKDMQRGLSIDSATSKPK
jgi:hypothetical protein